MEDLRETQIGNDGGLVEPDAAGADRVKGPDKGEQPEADVLEGLYDLPPLEVLLPGPRGIGRQAGLDEGLFLFGQPGRRLGDFLERIVSLGV